MSDVFISYVEEDRAVADTLGAALRDAGFTTWLYEQDSIAGEDYLLQTRQNIEGCAVFLVIISPQSLGSNQVYKEVVRAHECAKSFLPVLVNVTYADFERRQPKWAQAMGGAAAVTIPTSGDVESVVPRVIAGARRIREEQVPLIPADNSGVALPTTSYKPRRKPPSYRWIPWTVGSLVVGFILIVLLCLAAYLYTGKIAADAFADGSAALDADNPNPAAAIRLLSRSIFYRADNPQAYKLRARAYRMQSDYELALADYLKYLEHNDRDADIVMEKGETLDLLDRRDEAIKSYTRAIELSPSMTTAVIARGQDEYLLKQYDVAEADFNKVIAVGKPDPYGFLYRGRCREAKGKWSAAFDDYYAATKIGILQWQTFKPDYAIEDLSSLYAEAFGRCGRAYVETAKVDPSIRDLAQAIQDLRDGLSIKDEALRQEFADALSDAQRMHSTRSGRMLSIRNGRLTWNYDELFERSRGMIFVVAGAIDGARGRQLQLRIRIADASGKPLISPDPESNGSGMLTSTFARHAVASDPDVINNFGIFLPYSMLPAVPGKTTYRAILEIYDGDQLVNDSVQASFTFTYPAMQ